MAGNIRVGIDEVGEGVCLGVPEVVALVPFAGQAFGSDARPSVSAGRLQQTEQVEPDALLEVVVTFESNVGDLPVTVELELLLGEQRLESDRPGGCGIALRRVRDVLAWELERGPIGDVLRERDRLSSLGGGGERESNAAVARLWIGFHPGSHLAGRPVMVCRGRDGVAAVARPLDQYARRSARPHVGCLQRLRPEPRPDSRVVAGLLVAGRAVDQGFEAQRRIGLASETIRRTQMSTVMPPGDCHRIVRDSTPWRRSRLRS